jgi:hypothetical protein
MLPSRCRFRNVLRRCDKDRTGYIELSDLHRALRQARLPVDSSLLAAALQPLMRGTERVHYEGVDRLLDAVAGNPVAATTPTRSFATAAIEVLTPQPLAATSQAPASVALAGHPIQPAGPHFHTSTLAQTQLAELQHTQAMTRTTSPPPQVWPSQTAVAVSNHAPMEWMDHYTLLDKALLDLAESDGSFG